MNALRPYTLEILLAMAALVIVLALMLAATNARLSRTSRLLRNLLTGPEGEDLEAMLRENMSRVDIVSARSDTLENQLTELNVQLRGCVQNVGLVRFDAFGDVSGGQSFSVALLDGLRNGVIITGLFGRSDSRCFGKLVSDGQSEQSLSEEEAQALDIALKGGGGGVGESAPPRNRVKRMARSSN